MNVENKRNQTALDTASEQLEAATAGRYPGIQQAPALKQLVALLKEHGAKAGHPKANAESDSDR